MLLVGLAINCFQSVASSRPRQCLGLCLLYGAVNFSAPSPPCPLRPKCSLHAACQGPPSRNKLTSPQQCCCCCRCCRCHCRCRCRCRRCCCCCRCCCCGRRRRGRGRGGGGRRRFRCRTSLCCSPEGGGGRELTNSFLPVWKPFFLQLKTLVLKLWFVYYSTTSPANVCFPFRKHTFSRPKPLFWHPATNISHPSPKRLSFLQKQTSFLTVSLFPLPPKPARPRVSKLTFST